MDFFQKNELKEFVTRKSSGRRKRIYANLCKNIKNTKNYEYRSIIFFHQIAVAHAYNPRYLRN
jgi:hypothetical protein